MLLGSVVQINDNGGPIQLLFCSWEAYIRGGVAFGMTREAFDRLVHKTTLESSLVKTSVSGAGPQHVHTTAEWGRELH